MVVLCDAEIKKYLKSGTLKIEPLENPEKQIQPAWVDLRLGNEFRVFKSIHISLIDPKQPVEGYTEVVRVENKPFIIHPGEFVLGVTKEYIKMPNDLMGVVDGRSSLGRLGVLIHTTSAGINPGWEGILTLEISNVGKVPVALYPGMRVCKLVLHKLSSEPEIPYSARSDAKYHRQKGLEESKIFREFEEEFS